MCIRIGLRRLEELSQTPLVRGPPCSNTSTHFSPPTVAHPRSPYEPSHTSHAHRRNELITSRGKKLPTTSKRLGGRKLIGCSPGSMEQCLKYMSSASLPQLPLVDRLPGKPYLVAPLRGCCRDQRVAAAYILPRSAIHIGVWS